MSTLRLLAGLHGHLGVLLAAALIHPAILLRHGRPLSRGMRWAIGLTTLLTMLAFGLGLALYEDYRATVKRTLFATSAPTGLLFETKEHLAYAVLTLALGAGVCALVAPRGGRALRRAAAAAYAAAALLCLIVVGLGTVVAATQGFP